MKIRPDIKMPNSSNKKEPSKIHKTLLNFLLLTTVHGLPKIAASNRKLIQFMWIICLCGSTTACVYFVFRNIAQYLQFEVVTNFQIIGEIKSQFPTVSICSSVNVFKDKSLDELITKCSFSGDETCYRNKLISFQFYNDPAYDKCIRFNQNGLLESKIPGNNLGLGITFNIPYQSELYIGIFNQSALPATIYSRELFLAYGSGIEISVKRQSIEMLNEPYNSCIKNLNSLKEDKFIKVFFDLNITYTQKECYKYCSYSKFLEDKACPCNTKVERVVTDCYKNASESLRMCSLNFTKYYFKDEKYKECYKHCPLECDSFKLDFNIYSRYFNKNETELNIYYDYLGYSYYSQKPKFETFDLVSNTGGIIGLFIGTSFLSFIELIELIIEIFYIYLSKR